MTPSVTAQDLQDMPEYQEAVHALARYTVAQQTLDAIATNQELVKALDKIADVNRLLPMVQNAQRQDLLRAQAAAMQSFSAFVEALVKLLTM